MIPRYLRSPFRQSLASGIHLTFLFTALCATPLCAQPRAVLADGSGPWSTGQWAFTTSLNCGNRTVGVPGAAAPIRTESRNPNQARAS
jgi:hypothetical protein